MKNMSGPLGIHGYETQVKYTIVVNYQKICSYIADFVVTYKNGQVKVVDVKGYKTPVYRLKKKLMKAVLGIEVFEEI